MIHIVIRNKVQQTLTLEDLGASFQAILYMIYYRF